MSQFTEFLANVLRGENVNAGYTSVQVASNIAAEAAAISSFTVDIAMGEGVDFVLGTTTGTKVGTAASQKLGLYGATPVVQGAALTAQLMTITHTAPGADDFAIQDLTQTSPFGFVTKDEGNTVLKVVANLQARLAEVEARLEAIGLVAAN